MTTRILVVEDSPTQAEALRAVLEAAGYEVAVATSGEAGLARFTARKFDVVISDIVMPGPVDGYELCRRIKAGKRHETPVVLLTQLADPLDIILGLECGADKFFTKPYDAGHLLERLKVLLETREARARTRSRAGVKVFFMGQEFTITSRREQILDLLISTFEDAVRQNRELRRREEELAAINKELEAFTYSVSHDLRAPVRQVNGFAKALLEEFASRLDPAGQHYLQRIQEGSQHLGRLIDDLLTLAQVGRRELHPEATALNSLVQDVVVELKPETAGRQIEWRLGRLPTVECDPGLMRVAFTNLLSNAIKFTRPRKRALIQVDQTTVDGEAAVFVRDNGVGFDMKYADQLFGAFQRLHRAEEFEGTGVGLATVQRVVHKHGGRVWAQAQVDQGATFYFTVKAREP